MENLMFLFSQVEMQTIENVENLKQAQQIFNFIGQDLSQLSVFFDLDGTLSRENYCDLDDVPFNYDAFDVVSCCVAKKASVFILTANTYVASNLVEVSKNIFNPSFVSTIKKSLPDNWPQDSIEGIDGSFDMFCGNIICSSDKGFAAYHISQKLNNDYNRVIKMMCLIDDQSPFVEDFCMFAYTNHPPFPALGLKLYGGMEGGYYTLLEPRKELFEPATESIILQLPKKRLKKKKILLPALKAQSLDLEAKKPDIVSPPYMSSSFDVPSRKSWHKFASLPPKPFTLPFKSVTVSAPEIPVRLVSPPMLLPTLAQSDAFENHLKTQVLARSSLVTMPPLSRQSSIQSKISSSDDDPPCLSPLKFDSAFEVVSSDSENDGSEALHRPRKGSEKTCPKSKCYKAPFSKFELSDTEELEGLQSVSKKDHLHLSIPLDETLRSDSIKQLPRKTAVVFSQDVPSAFGSPSRLANPLSLNALIRIMTICQKAGVFSPVTETK